MPSKIIKTTERLPPRIIIHGGPGVGKTTLGANAPSPIFLRTENGTEGLGVDAYAVSKTWDEFFSDFTDLAKSDHTYKTVVIDALDGLERLIWHKVAQDNGKKSIEEIGYAKGYIFALDYWQRIIDGLTFLRERKGMNCLLLCHSIVKRHASPDLEEFDRYQPRLHDKAMGLLIEWADLIGFARSETVVRETEGGRAQGVATGRRTISCQDAAAFVGKNRYHITKPIIFPLSNPWKTLEDSIKLKTIEDSQQPAEKTTAESTQKHV